MHRRDCIGKNELSTCSICIVSHFVMISELRMHIYKYNAHLMKCIVLSATHSQCVL